MPIEVTNPSTQGVNKTSLSQPTAAGATTLDVYSNLGFSTNTLVLIESMGVQSAEYVTITGITGNTSLEVSATKFSHPQSAAVSFFSADTARVYKSTTGSSGSFSLWQSSAITPARMTTNFFDTQVSSNNAYYSTLFKISNSLKISSTRFLVSSQHCIIHHHISEIIKRRVWKITIVYKINRRRIIQELELTHKEWIKPNILAI